MTFLKLNRIIGSTASLHKCASFHGEDTIIYPVSATLVISNKTSGQQRFHFHTYPINLIETSPSYIASASTSPSYPRDPSAELYICNIDGSGAVKIADTGKGLSSMCFSPDERLLCCTFLDGTFQVYDLSNNETASSIKQPSDSPPPFTIFSPQHSSSSYIIFTAYGQSLYKIHLYFDRPSFSYRLALNPISIPSLKRNFASVTINSNNLFATTTAGEVLILNIETCSVVSVLSVGKSLVGICKGNSKYFAFAITNNGKVFGIQAVGQKYDLMEVNSDLPASVLVKSGQGQKSGDDVTFLTVSADNCIYLCKVNQSGTKSSLLEQSHTSPIKSIVSNPLNLDHVITADSAGRVNLWSLSSFKIISFVNLDGQCSSLEFSKFSKVVYVGTDRGVVYCLEYPSLRVLWQRQAHRGSVTSISAPSEGNFVASAGEDCTIKIFGKSSSKLVDQLESHTAAVRALKFDSDHQFKLHSAGDDRTIVTSDVTTSNRLVSHFLGDARFMALDQLDLEEFELVTIDTSKRLNLFDVDIGPSMGLLNTQHTSTPVSLHCGKDRTVVVGYADGTLEVIKVEYIDTSNVGLKGSPQAKRGQVVESSLTGHVGAVNGVVMIGNLIVSVGEDCGIFVWEV
ncbi:hypothetical protein P9112_013863 [Eukaryota sp. TZLM1-RC]